MKDKIVEFLENAIRDINSSYTDKEDIVSYIEKLKEFEFYEDIESFFSVQVSELNSLYPGLIDIDEETRINTLCKTASALKSARISDLPDEINQELIIEIKNEKGYYPRDTVWILFGAQMVYIIDEPEILFEDDSEVWEVGEATIKFMAMLKSVMKVWLKQGGKEGGFQRAFFSACSLIRDLKKKKLDARNQVAFS